jgi:DNA polymerase (family 10)
MLEIDGANPFRVRAYREASRVVDSATESVSAMAEEEGKLESLAGIGKDLAGKIRDLARTGHTELLDQMAKKIPLEVVGFTELQGLGPKRVKTVFETLGITTREQLGAAARDGKLRELPGFGEKVEQNVLKALGTAAQTSGRTPLAGAWVVAHALADHVKSLPGVQQVEIAGSFRRRRETIGDLDLLVSGGRPEQVMRAFVQYDAVADVLGEGETKSSVRLRTGLQVDLRLVPRESWGAALLYFTGSKEHNIELRRIAIEKGWSLNEYGLTEGEKVIAARTEAEVYRALDLDWIPPELRESRDEIALARAGRLPKLVELEDVVADLHMHSDRSDGRDSLEAMVRAAKQRGHRYIAITEHSAAIGFGRGFDAPRVRKSIDEIAAVRKAVPGIDVLHGLEVDILADGTLDLDDDSLALLDWVIVSLHSRLDQPAEVATARVLRALEHPAVCAMAHPTGRILGTREPSRFDMERVLDAAAARGVLMEINSQPDRLDLRDVHARLAREKGVRLIVDTDAHSVGQLDFLRYGVFVARRAGLTKHHVANTLPLERFRALTPKGGRKVVPATARAAARPSAKASAPRPKSPARAKTTARAKRRPPR